MMGGLVMVCDFELPNKKIVNVPQLLLLLVVVVVVAVVAAAAVDD